MSSGATRLRRFLKKHGITQIAAAKALGVSDPTIHDWLYEIKRPRAHHRQAIEVWTCGAVDEGSWMSADERDAMASVQPFDLPKAKAS